MGIHNLEKIFKPQSVAVIGASEKKGHVSSSVMSNLIGGGFFGDIFPVNPNHKMIWGLPTLSSVAEFKTPPDLAVIATPIDTVPQIIADCAEKGIGGAVIISAGGKETGAKGREIEAAIQDAAGKKGFRIVGPNCLGIINVHQKLNASFARQMPLPGKMAFVSQSGAICTAILDLSITENIGFSYLVSLGSMLDVDFGEMIDYLGNDPNVSSIVMYVENLKNIRNFMSAARSVSRAKPIIALKAGRSRAGARAAASHTGAMTGEDAVYDAAFRRAGIVRVKTFEELFDCAELLSKYTRTKGPGLAILTNAGGPGVMAADALSDYGVEPAALLPETLAKLNQVLPQYWSGSNPIDILGDATPERYEQAVSICLEARELNGILIMMSPQAVADPSEVANLLCSRIKKNGCPVFTVWMGGKEVENGRQIFNRAGIPTFDSPERAVRAFMDLRAYSVNVDLLNEIPSKLPKSLEFDREFVRTKIASCLEDDHFYLSEAESKSLLSAYGIPVVPTQLAISATDAVQKAEECGFPVALKISSTDILHKTEAGGVLLDLDDSEKVRNAYDQLLKNAYDFKPDAKIQGVSVQPMANREEKGYELILGAKLDRDFGPVILFGMGGVVTEVIQDRALALPPLNRLLARRLMEATKIYQLLKGHRNQPAVDLVFLEEMLVRLSQLMSDFSEIRELDINPLCISKSHACALDARIVLEKNDVIAPMHMVISPYPDEFEEHTICKSGERLFIRPIRPEDAPLLVENFQSLSKRTIYRRFFNPLRQLSPEMIARFTQIDYDREIALVAISETRGQEKLIGVSRIINSPDQKEAEFSVLVADQYQGQGVGSALLSRCLFIAKQRGVEMVEGFVLAENTQMLTLGKKLGFVSSPVQGIGEYRLIIDLRKNPDGTGEK